MRRMSSGGSDRSECAAGSAGSAGPTGGGGSAGIAWAQLLTVGIDDGGERLAARAAAVRKRSRRETHLTLELVEGKNREVRRLLAALGHEVTALKRVAFGGLGLGGLAAGAWRVVPAGELRAAFPGAPVR